MAGRKAAEKHSLLLPTAPIRAGGGLLRTGAQWTSNWKGLNRSVVFLKFYGILVLIRKDERKRLSSQAQNAHKVGQVTGCRKQRGTRHQKLFACGSSNQEVNPSFMIKTALLFYPHPAQASVIIRASVH